MYVGFHDTALYEWFTNHSLSTGVFFTIMD